jgi:hypothetical protein
MTDNQRNSRMYMMVFYEFSYPMASTKDLWTVFPCVGISPLPFEAFLTWPQ